MWRFDNILESWAMDYKAISHNPNPRAEHKAFYRISAIDDNNEFVKNHNLASSPAVAYSTLIDGRVERNKNALSYQHSIYILVKQEGEDNPITDEQEETLARLQGDEIVTDLLAWLDSKKKEAISKGDKETKMNWQGLDIESAEWATLPVRYEHWWICGLSIDQIAPRPSCVKKEKYHSFDEDDDDTK